MGRAAVVGIAWTSLAVSVFAGCGDLFHSTSFDTPCGSDPRGCTDSSLADDSPVIGIPAEAGPITNADAMPTDFCKWDSATARARAAHACAWLGACVGPLGNNALGTCMVNALLAYDCRINPARQVMGPLHAYWDCLASADTCGAVNHCVYPNGVQPCSNVTTEYFGCEGADGSFLENASVRVDCRPGGKLVAAENCIAVGQTCSALSPGACAGAGSADAACLGLACDGQRLRDCTGGDGDRGVDCALYGAGRCADLVGAACKVDGPSCVPTKAVTCTEAGVAAGCPAGNAETLDCAALFGRAGEGCTPVTTGSGWDVARACGVSGLCTESCDGTIARGCARGAAFSVDCGKVGLGSCALVLTEGNSRAACRP